MTRPKKLFFIIYMVLLHFGCACKNGKNIHGNSASDPIMTAVDKNNDPAKDTVVPGCIKILIDQFKKEEKKNPPRSIYQYKYLNKQVYFVPAVCCDYFSDLYDSDCKLMGHPDGGFTGRGDGKFPDFISGRTNEKLIWKDDRL